MAATDAPTRRWSSVVLGAVLVLGVAGLVVYAVAPVSPTPPDTGFYVLNESGTAANYSADVAVGEDVTVQVGIENDEGQPVDYDVVARSDGAELATRSVSLDGGETWSDELAFSFEEPGERRVDFLLTREDETADPYRRVYLRVTVRPS